MLKGKKVILGVCGSIAAYKTATLVRLFLKRGAEVQVVMTPDATQFITPLTLSTLSTKPVLVDYVAQETGLWNNHVHLGLWADFMLIAPASANTLAKFANGLCDNLLSAVYLSARCPVYLAPAMDLDMWAHPATQHNIALLKERKNTVIPLGTGELASGLKGEGRLAEPEEIITFLENKLTSADQPLKGRKALVTAGPTYEAIDPVRFIGNHSSGKMGFALAEALYQAGADVTLISGPTPLQSPIGIHRISVSSAQEMLEAALANFVMADITIMSAAVADYRPETVAVQKIKKNETHFSLQLTKTTDILATLGEQKRADQLLAGFALETHNELENALSKLKRKNLDFIVLNSMQDEGAGFAGDQNKITIIDRNEKQYPFPLKTKKEVAQDIVDFVALHFPSKDR